MYGREEWLDYVALHLASAIRRNVFDLIGFMQASLQICLNQIHLFSLGYNIILSMIIT